VGFGERSIPSPEPLTSGTSLSRERRSRADRLKVGAGNADFATRKSCQISAMPNKG
jgi:hypothetical protein